MKASKSATVKMHKKAANAAKKKPDLDGIALLELGVKAMDLKEYDKALPLFEEAYKTCMESTKVEMVKREKTEGGGEKNVNTTKKNTKETTTEKEQHQKDACEEAVKLILNKPGAVSYTHLTLPTTP